MDENFQTQYIKNVFEKNKDKNFVDRLINNDKYPAMDMRKEGPGEFGTHLMAYSSANGKYYLYPEIIYEDGKLKRLGRKEAFAHAMNTGEFIEFKTQDEAEWFGKNYKKGVKVPFKTPKPYELQPSNLSPTAIEENKNRNINIGNENKDTTTDQGYVNWKKQIVNKLTNR